MKALGASPSSGLRSGLSLVPYTCFPRMFAIGSFLRRGRLSLRHVFLLPWWAHSRFRSACFSLLGQTDPRFTGSYWSLHRFRSGSGSCSFYLSVQAYLVDAYTIYAASVLASNVLLRSGMGAAFPMFTGVSSHLFLILYVANFQVHVPSAGSALGIDHICVSRLGMRAVAILVLQVWRSHPESMSLCQRSGCLKPQIRKEWTECCSRNFKPLTRVKQNRQTRPFRLILIYPCALNNKKHIRSQNTLMAQSLATLCGGEPKLLDTSGLRLLSLDGGAVRTGCRLWTHLRPDIMLAG